MAQFAKVVRKHWRADASQNFIRDVKRHFRYGEQGAVRGTAMPLTRASGQTVFRRNGVRFLMKDGLDEIVCSISNPVLLDFGDTVGISDIPLIFLTYREKIERAASSRYDRSTREPYEILKIGTRDL
jgi:Protein of unknown function (DUF1488)